MILSLIAASIFPKSAKFVSTPYGSGLEMNGRYYPASEPKAFPLQEGMVRNADSNQLQYVVRGRVVGAIDMAKWRAGGSARPTSQAEIALTECLTLGDGETLGVVSVRTGHQVQNPFLHYEYPVTNQYLVRILPRPFRLEKVRDLPVAGIAIDQTFTPRRLYRRPNALYCIGNKKIEAIDRLGRSLRTVCRWKMDQAPIGECGGRWILGVKDSSRWYELWATNLSNGTARRVYRHEHSPRTEYYPYAGFGCTSNDSSYVLLYATFGGAPEVAGSAGHEAFTVHVPDGKRQAVSGFPELIAGPYAVGHLPSQGQDRTSVVLYSASTGRIVHRYRNSN